MQNMEWEDRMENGLPPVGRRGYREARGKGTFMNNQYQTAEHLNKRITIHDRYSVNKQGFSNWIYDQYRFSPGDSILELGCGSASMWIGKRLPAGCRLYLTDFSEGMLEAARKNTAQLPLARFQRVDIQGIPFEDNAFDSVIAHMMLYHVPDMHRALAEVRRVLKPGGSFFCATYGENGIMAYLSAILNRFGVYDPMNRRFTLQNGEEILKKHFPTVVRQDYPDALAVTDPEDLSDYLYSMGSMTNLDPAYRPQIVDALHREMKNGVLTVPKEYGMFICR